MKRVLILLLVGAMSGVAGKLPTPINCDNQPTTLNPAGKITVLLASSQPLAETTRLFGRSIYGWQGQKDFRVIVVVDLRKSLGSWFKGWSVGAMKANLDEESEALVPWYRANGNRGIPRPDLCAIPDFDGKISESLGWGANEKIMKVTLFGKEGEEIWTSREALSPAPLQAELKKLLGSPVATPVEALPKKSKILKRRS